MRFFLALAFLLLVKMQASAESNLGLAYYAIQHKDWPCERSLEVYKDVPIARLSFLWHTFGEDLQCLERFLQIPQKKVLHVHLVNETCQRDNSCGSYEFVHNISINQYRAALNARNQALLDRFRAHIAPLQKLLERYRTGLDCSISPGLESNLSRKAASILIEEVRRAFPYCTPVWNPVGNNRFGIRPIPEVPLELHGSKAALTTACIAGLDGEDIGLPTRPALLKLAIDYKAIPQYLDRMKSCSANYLWIAEFNGLDGKSPPDPRQRANFPSPEQFDYFREFLTK